MKKQNKMKKLYFFLLAGILLLISCEKLVEVDYPTNQIGTRQVFEDVQTANAALTALYSDLRNESVIAGAGYYSISTLAASYVDNLECYNNDQNGLIDIWQNKQLETNRIISNIWSTAYEQIYYANSVIDGVEQSTDLSEDDKARIKGEALLMRSFIYFYLQQIFGDIPYSTSLDYEYNRNLSKTDAATVLVQLETDLSEAVGLLEDSYRDVERIYPNRKVAELLLAKIYLTEQKYDLAEQMVSTILQSPLYQFQPDLNEVFHKNSKNVLWQIKPENSGNSTKEASFYYFENAAPNAYTLTQDLIDTFADNDLRKQVWMTEVSFNGDTWYRPYKYKNRFDNANEYSVVFRLEEVYFIMAEALAKQNRVDEALPYLNASRERAGLTALTSMSTEDFINEMLIEKRREFFTEFGNRFLDLKRLGRLSDLSVVKPNWEFYEQVWPLPQNELLLNSNLYPQNTGY